MEMDGTLVESLGFETKDDIYCRKFKMTQEIDVVNKTQGGNGSMKVEFFIWEDYGARRLHRLEYWVSARTHTHTHTSTHAHSPTYVQTYISTYIDAYIHT